MTAQRKPKAPSPAQYAPKPKQPNYIAAIHVAQGKLRLTEDDARSLKLAVIGVDSCKDMTVAQQAKLLRHLSKLVDDRDAKDWQDARWRKVIHSWRILHEAGEVRDGSQRALRLFMKGITKMDHWSFMNDLERNDVLDRIMAWRRRVGL